MKTVGNDKTIYHGRAAGFPLKTLRKCIENTRKWLKSNKLPGEQEKSIYRAHRVRALCSSVSDRMNHFKYPRLTRDSICETDGFHATNLIGIRPTNSSLRGDRSMSINRWSWTLSFTTTICFFGKGIYFLYKEKCYDELSQFWNSKYIGMRKSVGRFKNLDFESYGYLICKSKYGVKNAIASKQLYLNVVEDIDVIAKDVQHLLRYDILSFMATCDTSNILAIRDL